MAGTAPQSVTRRILLKAFLSSDHSSVATGKTIAIVISKNGGAFGNPSAGATNATEIANGWYYVDLSTADTATLGPIVVRGTSATIDDTEWDGDIVNANNAGLAALPNAAAEASGGLYTRGSGAGQINQANNGQIDTNAARLGGTTQTGRDVGTSVLLSTGTGTGQLDFTSGVVKASLAQILGTAITETSGQIAAAFKQFFDIATPTGTMKAITNVVTTTNLTTNNDKTGYGLSAAAVQAVWDALTSALTTVGSIGKLLVDNINATISSRLASASYTTPPTVTQIRQEIDSNSTKLDATISSRSSQTSVDTIDDFLDTEIAAIKAKTDNLPSSVKKNTALSNFVFMMFDSADHVTPKTGLTVTATRAIDGGSFASCANSVSEVATGWYKINLAAADLNGDTIALKFTSTGADTTNIAITTNS